MPYSNSWSDVIPAGTAQASTIDDQIRQLRLDIRERMDTILALGGKWTDDPIVLDLTATGALTGRKIFISGFEVQHVSDNDDTTWDDVNGRFVTTDSGIRSVCPVRLPVGVTITRVRTLVANNLGVLTIELHRRPFQETDAGTTVATLTSNITGMNKQMADTGAGGVAHVVDESIYYFVNIPVVVLGAIYAIYGYEITVDVPNLNSYV